MLTESERELIEQWKRSVEDFAVSDIRKCLTNDIIEAGLLILTLSAIESISGYFEGKRADRTTFANFLRSNYFPDAYHPIADQLYPLRNGLLHDYATDSNRFVFFRTREQGYGHLASLHTNYGLVTALNREQFATDFLNAWGKLSDATLQDESLSARILSRIRDTNRGFLVVKEIVVYPPLQPYQTPPLSAHVPLAPSSEPIKYTGGTVSFREQTEQK